MQSRHPPSVAVEVLDVPICLQIVVPPGVYRPLCGGIYDTMRIVRVADVPDAVFLRLERVQLCPPICVVYSDDVVIRRGHQQVLCPVKRDGVDPRGGHVQVRWDGVLCVSSREHSPPGEAPHGVVIYADHTVSVAGEADSIVVLSQRGYQLEKTEKNSTRFSHVAGPISRIPSTCKRPVCSSLPEVGRRR